MTDNEIMKAMETCKQYLNYDTYTYMAVKRGLDLINRQKTEIRITRIEAIKEFAEKLKSYMSNLEANSPNKAYKTAMEDMLSYYVPKIIDDVVKEMTGDTNG